MGYLRTTLLALGAVLALGATLAGTGHTGPRLVQTTLDRGDWGAA